MIRDLNYLEVYNIFVYKKSTKNLYSEILILLVI